MKSKKNYIIISIIVLSFLVYSQFNSFYNNAYANYIINPVNTIDRNNYNNVVYASILDTLKLKIKNQSNNVVIIIDDDYRDYTDGLAIERAFSKTYLYPINVIEVRYSNEINDWMINYFSENSCDKVIFLGHNFEYLSSYLEYDVNIYDMDSNGKLHYNFGYNSDLYSLSEIFKESGNISKYNDLLNTTEKMAFIYHNESANDEIRKLADSYYDRHMYNDALKFYKMYLLTNYDEKINDLVIGLEKTNGGDFE